MGGETLHFEWRGLYDGVSILRDRESSSFWNHITGEAMWGPHKGAVLAPTYNALQMQVGDALETYPDIAVALSDRPITGEPSRWSPLLERIPVLGDRFRTTMAPEDTRRPTMDVGLGLWTEQHARYYPLETIVAAGNVIVDRLDGRTVVIAYPPDARAPIAFHLNTRSAEWNDGALVFGDGSRYVDGRLYDADGNATGLDHPMQLFTRWYGFALTFPDTEIYRISNFPS